MTNARSALDPSLFSHTYRRTDERYSESEDGLDGNTNIDLAADARVATHHHIVQGGGWTRRSKPQTVNTWQVGNTVDRWPCKCCPVEQDVSTVHPLGIIRQIHLNMTQAARPCRSTHRLASNLNQLTDDFSLFSTQGWANNLLDPRLERNRGCRRKGYTPATRLRIQ